MLQNKIKFPAVTVCNQNRVDCEKLEIVKLTCERLQAYYNLTQQHRVDNKNSPIANEITDAALYQYNGTQFEGNGSFDLQISRNIERNITKTNKQREESENEIRNIKNTAPQYTICQKISLTEDKTIVQYLFDEGKCGKICRAGALLQSLSF